VNQPFKQEKEITYFMCDRTNRLTLSMLVNILMDVSEKHSAYLGTGEEVVKGMGYNWIILHYEFQIEKIPKVNERVEIETIATEYNKLFTYRDFIVRGKDNNEIITVKTTFALMDLEKRKMARLPEEIIAPYQATFSKRIRRNTKPQPVDNERASQKVYSVRYFDIDSNNHVNNSQYINWLLDSMDGTFLATHTVKHGIITFDKEVNEEDTVTSSSSRRVANNSITDHQITVDGTIHATASFHWDTA